MAEATADDLLRKANVRLCRLCTWPNIAGLGFTVEAVTPPPHIIRTVDSNSPAAASGLKILDVVLAVNNQDVSQSNYNDVKIAIRNAVASNNSVELLVVEQRFYGGLKSKGVVIDPTLARVIKSPATMPSEYQKFPKNTPRTCEIKLKKTDTTFGFEIVNGQNDVGVIIQEVTPNSPAVKTSLRKSDRVLEVDDVFVDDDPSRSILEKFGKAKGKGAVKLYVVDTNTYKYFKEKQIPLQSKEFKKGKYEKKLKSMSQTDQDDPQSATGVRDDRPPPSSNSSTLARDTQSNLPDELHSREEHTDDIRLCTINRAHAKDSFGLEFNYQIREKLSIIKIPPGKNNGPSNAALAGVKEDDRLIEINGKNVEHSSNEEIKQRIHSNKYPEKLQILVADKATYDYYKAQKKTIHSGLPSVQYMAENIPGRPISSVPTSRRPTETSLTSTQPGPDPSSGIAGLLYRPLLDPTQPVRDSSVDTTASKNRTPLDPTRPVQDPSSGLGALKNQNPLESSQISTSGPYHEHPTIDLSSESVRQCRLQRTPDDSGPGFGFSLTPNKGIGEGHQIGLVTPLSPASRQGLRVGDYIKSVNNENVERMTPTEFTSFLKNEAQKAGSTRDGILLLEVVNEDTLNVSKNQRTPSHISNASRTPAYVSEHDRTASRLSTVSRTPINDNEPYPELRLCTVRAWPNYPELGFEIVSSSSTGSGNDGYRIQHLQKDSPAAHTNIYNGDHLIEINGRNMEDRDLQHVQQYLDDSYTRHHQVKLLVVDGTGYQWYKNRRLHIGTSDIKSNYTEHVTPAPPSDERDNITSASLATQRNPNKKEFDQKPTHTSSTSQPQTSRPYNNGFSSPGDDGYAHPRKISHITSPISRSQKDLSRAAVHIVSGKDVYRFCRLTTESNGTFGFRTEFEDNKHLVRNVIPNSPAAKAGLNNGDGLIEVDKDDIRQKTHQEVQSLLDAAIHKGIVHLLIMPSNIKPLTNRSAKSLTALNDKRYYRDSNSSSPYADQHKNSTFHINGEQSYSINDLPNQSSTITDPLPRRCLLVYDPAFRGCGFRVSKKENYDTPIVVEVCANSPAKRSGLTEGDHIIYIGSQNIQNINSFNEMTHLIQNAFEDNGQIALTTLTGPAYQLLKQRGGYLHDTTFDYQSPNTTEMKPRLCKLSLYNHEHNFGFRLKYGDRIYVRDVEAGSAADVYDIRKDDRILELNGQDTAYLSDTEINEIIKSSEKDRKLDILVIDKNGYEFSMKHAIPLNSFLPFVQLPKERATTISRTQQEAVYL